MGTFPLGHIHHQLHVANAHMIEALARQTTGDVSREHRTVVFAPDPMSMRGIPAVGRNCPGAIRHTNPEGICSRE